MVCSEEHTRKNTYGSICFFTTHLFVLHTNIDIGFYFSNEISSFINCSWKTQRYFFNYNDITATNYYFSSKFTNSILFILLSY